MQSVSYVGYAQCHCAECHYSECHGAALSGSMSIGRKAFGQLVISPTQCLADSVTFILFVGQMFLDQKTCLYLFNVLITVWQLLSNFVSTPTIFKNKHPSLLRKLVHY
jgi:hypothetical protein